jgi:hypothetical protein
MVSMEEFCLEIGKGKLKSLVSNERQKRQAHVDKTELSQEVEDNTPQPHVHAPKRKM